MLYLRPFHQKLILAAMLFIAAEKPLGISLTDRAIIASQAEKNAQTTVENYILTESTGSVYSEVKTTAQIFFDEKRLISDGNQFKKTVENDQIKKRGEHFNSYLQNVVKLKEMLKEPEQTAGQDNKKSPPTKDTFVADKDKVRFGSLNLDILGSEINLLTNDSQDPTSDSSTTKQNNQQLVISLSPPSFSEENREEFKYNPLDYLAKIELDIFIANFNVEKSKENSLKLLIEKNIKAYFSNEKIAIKVNLKSMASPSKTEASHKTPAPLPVPEADSWIKKFSDPNSASLALLIGSIILGIFILLAFIMLKKVGNNLTSALKELKPKEESAADTTLNAQWVDQSAADSEHKDEEKSTFDPAIAAQALTAEMRTIRDQFAQLVKDSPSIIAELIRDFYYDATSLGNLKDLLSFVGYQGLKPALNLLPIEYIDDLKGFIEESSDTPQNILGGASIAQQIYQEAVSRISVDTSSDANLEKIRELLLKCSDQHLSELLKKASAEQTAILLNMITMERGNKILAALDKAILKKAYPYFDMTAAEIQRFLPELKDFLNDHQVTDQKKSSKKSRRFIMRLLKHATIEDESAIANLIDQDDWGTKIAILSTHFFYQDLKYLPHEFLKNVFESFPPKFRSIFLFLCAPEIKNTILSFYKDGSKVKEMLTVGVGELEKNEKEAQTLKKQSSRIIVEFMERVRLKIKANNDILKEVILKQCEELKVAPPEQYASDNQDHSTKAA